MNKLNGKHGTYKIDKVRVIFYSIANHGGTFFNNKSLSGLDLINYLTDVLIRFWTQEIGFMIDRETTYD